MFRVFSQYVSRRTLFFLMADAGMMALAVVAAFKIRYLNDPEAFAFFTELPDFGYRILAIVFCFQVCAYYNELYSAGPKRDASDQFFRLAQALGVGCFLLATIYFLSPSLRVGRSPFALALALMLVGVTLFRYLFDRVGNAALPKQRVLVFGAEPLTATIAEEINTRPDLNMHLVGYVSSDSRESGDGTVLPGHKLGYADGLEDVVRAHNVAKIIVGHGSEEGTIPVRQLLRLRARGVQVEQAQATLSALTGRIPLDTLDSSWFVFSDGFWRSRYAMAFKRMVDLFLSVLGLLLALPLMLLTALIVKLGSRGPILFRQQRVGLNGTHFEVIKFRTMKPDAESDGVARFAQKDDPRITGVGKYLRQYRLDELPQFINVIRGDMSFVGPRPERPEFVERLCKIEPLFDERHTVRPGLTGWAQVCYPYGATEQDSLKKLEYDLFYLKNVSALFDIAIVFQTVKTILWGRGQ